MKDPWEETWEWRQTDPVVPSSAPGHSGAVHFPKGRMAINCDPGNYSREEGKARGRLAAAAPEMARLLLALSNEHGDRRTFDWAYWSSEIEDVLRKAGVLQSGEDT